MAKNDETEDFVDASDVEPEKLTTFPVEERDAIDAYHEEIEATQPDDDTVDETLKRGADMPVDGVELDMAIVRDRVHRAGPYTVDGFNVFDNRGQRVAMCGTDQNRKASGPLFAAAVREALNKMAGY